MSQFPSLSTQGFYLEAEVPSNTQGAFESRYSSAAGATVSPRNRAQYQDQPNKWGAELRIYFNDASVAALFQGAGITVENRNSGYKSGEFMFRTNNNDLWWDVVENHGCRLGHN